jgi:hypothetical protein
MIGRNNLYGSMSAMLGLVITTVLALAVVVGAVVVAAGRITDSTQGHGVTQE